MKLASRRALATAVSALALALVVALAVPASAQSGPPDADETTMSLPDAAAESVGLRLIEAPADAIDDPRAQIFIVDHLAPGASIDRRIEVSSTTSAPTRVALYSAAASIEGTSFTGAEGHETNELSSWTTVDRASVELAAGGTAIATVSIDVPPDAAPGEQYAVVWAEVRATPDVPGGVVQVSRVGIRLYVSIGPGGPPAADFTINSLAAARSAGGAPVVTASVTNTGGRALELSGTLQLSEGPGVLQAGPYPVPIGTTLGIGDTQPVRVSLDRNVPAGPWKARIDLRSGRVERSGEATITFPDTSTAAAVPVTGSRVPLLLAGAIALVAAVVGAWLLWRRHQRRRPWAPRTSPWRSQGGTA